MSHPSLFPWTRGVYRTITGPLARRFYFSVLVLLVLVTITARVRSTLLLRQISPILSGMARIQLDQTSEEEFLRMVPSLVRTKEDWNGQHVYYLEISNESEWLMRHIVFGAAPEWVLRVWDWLGYRYLYFEASAMMLDGKVSDVYYGLGTRIGFPREASYIVSAKSVHGFWARRGIGFAVTSTLDESPQYQVSGSEERGIGDSGPFLRAVFTPEAPHELISHAFHIDLSCF
jgi:hypothetical protein